jgi:hypothetical protein
MFGFACRTILAASALLAVSLPASADYLDPIRPFALFPDCTSGSVLARLTERSNWAERTAFHYGSEIDHIANASERTVESFGPAPILRRYCRATAEMSDGRKRTVHYRIEKGMGLAGTGYKLEFCVAGRDRWRVFNGNCRVLRR